MNFKLNSTLKFLSILVVLMCSYQFASGQTGKKAVVEVTKISDFSIDGQRSAEQWIRTGWIPIAQRSTTKRMPRNKAPDPADRRPPARLTTRAKVLYSNTGIYFLVQCEDRVLQATMDADFMELWWEDVVEIFLWPHENDLTYFEYQLSPLNYELILRITNDKRSRSSWQPFSYIGDRSTRHKTYIKGGTKESGASITQWTAEVFIPFKLLHPGQNIPPTSGTRWRANLYRLDYDTGDRARWEWQPVNGSNHELEKYGTFVFK